MQRIILLLLFGYSAYSQGVLSYAGGQSWGMGNAITALANPQSFFGNPAGLARLSGFGASVSHHSRFNINGLATTSVTAFFSRPSISLALGGQKFGDRLYAETGLGAALSKRLGHTSLGVKVSYSGRYAENYTSQSAVLTEFGVLSAVHPKVDIGFWAQNLTRARFSNSEILPTRLVFGVAFNPARQVLLTADTEYELRGKPAIRAGMQYTLREQLMVRIGINPVLQTNHFGVGYSSKHWQFDYATHTHPALGLSHHFSLAIQFAQNEEVTK